MPVVGDERREGWLAALHPVVYPDESRRRQQETATPTGCPRFGLDSVARRADRAPGRERSVAPGRHAPEIGTHRVVWWDPATLALDVEETVGLRQQKLLEADESGATERGVQAHAPAGGARRCGRRSVRMVRSIATVWAARLGRDTGRVAEAAAAVAVERASGGGGDRPHGVRFGVLVHTVLASIDLDADAAAIRAATTLQARLVGAPTDETDAAAATVARALAHPLLRRAALAERAGRCRREVALALALENGTLVEGDADLTFCDADARRRGRSSISRPIASSVAAYRSIAGSSGSTRKRWHVRPGTPLAPSCCTLPRRPRRPVSLLRGARDPACSISASLVRSDARTARSSGAAGAAARS